MSTEIPKKAKKYQLKARAESQRETRDSIARAASQLHAENGVAQTTVAEIARLAGVSRLTVYNHFPDLESLLPACTAHFESQHPFPDLTKAFAEADPHKRLRGVLAALYPWYRETDSMWCKVFGDRAVLPELDEFLRRGIDANLDRIAADLAAFFSPSRKATAQRLALTRLALDFWSWHRLTQDGLGDSAAVTLMANVVAGVEPTSR